MRSPGLLRGCPIRGAGPEAPGAHSRGSVSSLGVGLGCAAKGPVQTLHCPFGPRPSARSAQLLRREGRGPSSEDRLRRAVRTGDVDPGSEATHPISSPDACSAGKSRAPRTLPSAGRTVGTMPASSVTGRVTDRSLNNHTHNQVFTSVQDPQERETPGEGVPQTTASACRSGPASRLRRER